MAEDISKERKKELDRAQQLKDEIMQGLQKAEPAEKLLLKAIESLALIEGDTVSYKEAKNTMLAVYGAGLEEEQPLKIELEEYQNRRDKIQSSYEKMKDSADEDTISRILSAIRAHDRHILELKDKISHTKS